MITNNTFRDTSTIKYTISSAIVDLPLSLKIQSDRYNAFRYRELMRHYLITGVKLGIDLGSLKAASISSKQYSLEVPKPNIIKGTDMALELGFGLSFFLRYATISPEVKFSYGLRDLRINDPNFPLVTSLHKMTSNFIYFTILVEN
jgi:hypothetical protein